MAQIIVSYSAFFFGRGDGTCSARFLPFYSLSLYAFIFIKGIFFLFILCFNSLSRLPLKTRHSRRVFFTRRSSPVFIIKKSCVGKCRCKIFGRGDGTCSARFPPPYSLPLYAFIFIKGILLLFILCFNSLSRLPLKTRHSRRVFFTLRSSPVFMIKKILHRQMPMQDFWSR